MFGSRRKEPAFKFDNGDELVDTITGFKGIVISRTQWLHNCNTYTLKPLTLNKEGGTKDDEAFDEPQLKVVIKQKVTTKRDTGGPTPTITKTNR